MIDIPHSKKRSRLEKIPTKVAPSAIKYSQDLEDWGVYGGYGGYFIVM